MKKTYRHIGYYNDYFDVCTLFGRTPDFIVQYMLDKQGAFVSKNGDYDTDINDYNDEHDANAFQLTTDKNYLIRFERGNANGEGWYIDIYKLMEVEVEDTNKDDGNKVYEYCPHCENEVVLDNEFKVQVCPDCGHAIVPCSICPLESCVSNCPLDVLCRQKNKQNEENDTALLVTSEEFVDLFKKEDLLNQECGFYLDLPKTSTIEAQTLLFRYCVDYGIYLLTNQTHCGEAYTWANMPSYSEFFDGVKIVSFAENDNFKIRPNF